MSPSALAAARSSDDAEKALDSCTAPNLWIAQGSDTNLGSINALSCLNSTEPHRHRLDLWEVRANRAKTRRTGLTALEPLVFPRISTEIAVVLAPAVDGMLSQPSPAPRELNVGLEDPDQSSSGVY